MTRILSPTIKVCFQVSRWAIHQYFEACCCSFFILVCLKPDDFICQEGTQSNQILLINI